MSNPTEAFAAREAQLTAWCTEQLAWLRAKSEQFGKRLRRYRALALFFSVCVTVLSGIAEIKNLAPWAVTVAAGFSTFFSGLLSISKAEENYATYVSASGQYRRELMLYQQQAGVYAGLDEQKKLAVFAERIANIDEQIYTRHVKDDRAASGGT